MAEEPQPGAEPRPPLTRERILRAAVELADANGIESLTMRRLGEALGVEAMSLYNHVDGKDDILDGMIDAVFAEIDLPSVGADWKPAMRRRALSAREALSRHPWATALMNSQEMAGPAALRLYDSVIGCLREAGFSREKTLLAFSVLDSYLYGFALQEITAPHDLSDERADVAETVLRQLPADDYPYLADMIAEHVMEVGYDPGDQFERGLDLILDGLERLRDAA